jgi:hypothetical protein
MIFTRDGFVFTFSPCFATAIVKAEEMEEDVDMPDTTRTTLSRTFFSHRL